MDAANSPPSYSLRSKKQPHSPAPSDPKARRAPEPDPNPWGVQTPGKPADPPRRLRNRGAAMSIKEIREAAMKLRGRRSDPSEEIVPVVESKVEPVAKSKKKPSVSEIKLLEKYELLDKFFNSLDSSIRLLHLKGSAPIFANISSQVESLTDRRFTYSHLAQLKFIMPEAIMLEKVLRHDERTSCMRPDLRITLNAEAVESKNTSQSLSGNLRLRKVFRSRLLDFLKSHTEGEEVPEGPLPEPFSRPKKNASENSVQPSTSNSITETPLFGRQLLASSLLPPSFKPRFSQRASIHSIEVSKQDKSLVLEENCLQLSSNSQSKLPLNSPHSENCSSGSASSDSNQSPLHETPVKCVKSVETVSVLSTPVGPNSTPAKLRSATPALRPPKRSQMSPDDSSCRSPSKLIRRPPPNRPLKFDTPVKNSKVNLELDRSESRSNGGDDILDILPDALVQSIREKERLAAIEQDPAISRAKSRQKMIASLPKRFDTIYYLFQSMGRSVVTKEELIQKIVTGDLKVTDRNEVEEQLTLLQELVPEWIYEKSITSGDLLICVNKISSPEAIRTRLSEAK
ncbi:CDT1-like protein a- chloroplastic [Striga hermonthica]|uniref:CDT1-like protein a- chloroplastic n=1 Tax=Striga hermonthica TaxID=68872 RepID=A0A9N7NHZ3_STRHE|nr:CDT1-like protein a- chloroplastic [Striga hermonthica]